MKSESLKDCQNIILIVNGGIGRNIMSTAVVRNLKKTYPEKKIVVVCGTPEVFMKNPNVHRIYHLGNPVYLYEDYIQNSKSIFLDVEPYRHFDYIYKRKHFVECWCDLLGIECDSIYPELFFSDAEKELAKEWLKQWDKDFVLCQFEGGKVPENPSNKERVIAREQMYKRSIPEKVQQSIANDLMTLNYKVGVVASETQFRPGCVEWIHYPVRTICALVEQVKYVICIDSFLLHACSAMNKKALVLWSGTSPDTLGYDLHLNVRRNVCDTPECHRPNSFLFDIQPTSYQWECPVNNICTKYDSTLILENFLTLTGGRHGESRITEPIAISCGQGCSTKREERDHGNEGSPVSKVSAIERTA